jgi:ABC-2 type transport system permease protein
MRNVWTIAKREYQLFFISPIAYVIGFFILLTLGLFFFFSDVNYAIMQPSFVPDIKRTLSLLLWPLFFVAVPALTMRSLAEENRAGTLELLLTAPIQDWELVVGKWLGCVLYFISIIAVTWVYPVILNALVKPGIDQGLLVTGYLGLILVASALCAIGVMASSFFSNQIAALFTSFGIIIILWIFAIPADFLNGAASDIVRYISFPEHYYDSFINGVIQLKDIIYYLSITVLGLLFGSLSIEQRRWR